MTKVMTFALRDDVWEIVKKWPKFKAKMYIGRSEHVNRAIRAYEQTMNPKSGNRAVAILNARIAELEAKIQELEAQPPTRSIIQRFVRTLNRPFRPRKQG